MTADTSLFSGAASTGYYRNWLVNENNRLIKWESKQKAVIGGIKKFVLRPNLSLMFHKLLIALHVVENRNGPIVAQEMHDIRNHN